MSEEKVEIIKKDTKKAAALTILVSFFVFSTNPGTLPVVLLLIVPVLVSLLSVFVVRLLISVFSNMNKTDVILASNSVGFFVLTIMALGTLKQLRLIDFVLVSLLVAGISFYVYRSNTSVGSIPQIS